MKLLLATASLLSLAPLAFGQITTEPEFVPAVARQVAKVHATDARGPFHADWNSLAQYRTPAWFQDVKFGIFLHWGVYSVPAFGNEWYSRNMYVEGNPAYKHHLATYGPQTSFGYKDFIPQFKAERFDPSAWIDLFEHAGARYIVPVAEHCDGFPMYDSGFTRWTSVRMGPHRDVVGEIAMATRAHGLHFGLSSHRAEHWWWYGQARNAPSDVTDAANAGLYGPAATSNLPNPDGSTTDRKQPDPDHLERWLPPDTAFLDDWLARSTELVDKYHPEFVYFDWWIGQPAFKPYLQQFAAYYYDRSAQAHISPVLTYKGESMPADVATLDIERGKLDTLRLLPWQTDTSVSVHSWGYAEHDEYRSATSLLHQLLDTVSKNGNLLLNVGPKADGTIPDEARSVLLEMGAWLKVNGEAIYGTRPFTVFGEGPTKAPKNPTAKDSDIQTYTAEDIRFTVPAPGGKPEADILYATALGWPATSQLTVHTLFRNNPYLAAPVCSVDLLGASAPIPFTQAADGLRLTLPSAKPNASAYVFRIHTGRCAGS